ncbi:MAG: thioredoxin-dependent thiol peroxidase [Bacteroidota bacterium]|jgi:peroxiredoxin Q/BCP|nr:thioredoxin-dependent thiol peroxidase [Bacteroidota bacterium]
MIEVGGKAPAFTLPSSEGGTVSLTDFSGKKVVLYFYPKDNTPGCTLEACDFRDNFSRIQSAGAVVLGISGDSLASHEKFRDRFALPFPLLSDETHAMMEAYGVWKEKKNYGRTYMGIERTTVLIDGAGIVRRIWPKVTVKGHVDAVLAALSEA